MGAAVRGGGAARAMAAQGGARCKMDLRLERARDLFTMQDAKMSIAGCKNEYRSCLWGWR
jgi:hypothetical protein